MDICLTSCGVVFDLVVASQLGSSSKFLQLLFRFLLEIQTVSILCRSGCHMAGVGVFFPGPSTVCQLLGMFHIFWASRSMLIFL